MFGLQITARIAIQNGAAGVIVSNHGARQLDYVPATIMALEEVLGEKDHIFQSSSLCWPKTKHAHNNLILDDFQVVKAARGEVPVFLDGGVRRGTDVFKALALGASGIFVSKKNTSG